MAEILTTFELASQMTESEIDKVARELWRQDRRLQFTEFYQLYLLGMRRGIRIGEEAEAKRIYADTLEMTKEEVSGVPV